MPAHPLSVPLHVPLHRGGNATPARTDELPSILRGPSIVWAAGTAHPYVRPFDGLRLVPGDQGLILVDRDGQLDLAIGSGGLARVAAIWRRPMHISLDGAFGGLLGRPAAFQALLAAQTLQSGVSRLVREWSTTVPSGPEAFYAQAAMVEDAVGRAHSGLSESEAEVLRILGLDGPPTAVPPTAVIVGCGAGREAIALAARGWDVVGVDMIPALIDAARAQGSSARFEVGSADDLPVPTHSAKVVWLASEVYRGIRGRSARIRAIREARRIVAKKGAVVVSCSVGRSALGRWLVDTPRAVLRIAEPGDRRVPAGPDPNAPDEFRHDFADADEVIAELREAGLEQVDVHDGWYIGHPTRHTPAARSVKVRPRNGVVARPSGDHLVIVDLEGGGTYRLNRTGAAIWNALVAGADRDAMIAAASPGHVDPEHVGADVDALLADLRAAGLVEDAR